MKTSEYAAQPCSLTWTKRSSDRRRDWHSRGYGRRHRPENHLPLLNGGLFQSFSRGGGIITAVQVAYWTSPLTVAIHTTGYLNDWPALLIIDTSQLALNAQVTARYRGHSCVMVML
jgi:hypothetical protein